MIEEKKSVADNSSDVLKDEVEKKNSELDRELGAEFAKLTGGASEDYGKMMFNQLHHIMTENVNNPGGIVEILRNIKPKDSIEGMLVTQMVATHSALMRCYSHSDIVYNMPCKRESGDTALNLANKLARTYTIQMEALNKYRGKGQQKMTVEHVHVNSGGQAIIGNVTSKQKSKGGGDKLKR